MVCCIKGYHKYKDIEAAATRKVLVYCRWHAVVGKIFVVKLYSCKIFLYVFCVRKYFCNEKKVNYGIQEQRHMHPAQAELTKHGELSLC